MWWFYLLLFVASALFTRWRTSQSSSSSPSIGGGSSSGDSEIDTFFVGKRVLLTGAGRGIGAHIAKQLAAAGARLVLCDIDSATLAVTAKQCAAVAPVTVTSNIASAVVDVTNDAQVRAAVATCVSAYGGMDVLLLNHAYRVYRAFPVTDLATVQKIMDTNFLGSVRCTQLALPHLQQSSNNSASAAAASIVVVSSAVGKIGLPHQAAYAASKHALHGFFDSLRAELALPQLSVPHAAAAASAAINAGDMKLPVPSASTATTTRPVSISLLCPGLIATEYTTGVYGSAELSAQRAMSAHECATAILTAAARRAREQFINVPFGRLLYAVRAIAPAVVDWVVARRMKSHVANAMFETPIAKPEAGPIVPFSKADDVE